MGSLEDCCEANGFEAAIYRDRFECCDGSAVGHLFRARSCSRRLLLKLKFLSLNLTIGERKSSTFSDHNRREAKRQRMVISEKVSRAGGRGRETGDAASNFA